SMQANSGATPGQSLSDDVFRGQDARLVGVGQFDLDRRVLDAKRPEELLRDAAQHSIPGMAARHYEMAGQRRLSRAHPPDMEIMQPRNARQSQELHPYRRRIAAHRPGDE